MKKFSITTSALLTMTASLWANNVDNFMEHDQYGIMMTIISMAVVFSALLILFICFKWADKVLNRLGYLIFVLPYKSMKKAMSKKEADKATATGMKITDSANGQPVEDEALATAIGVALFLHEDGMHDTESGVLTLDSPFTNPGWTGCGHNHRQVPQRNF